MKIFPTSKTSEQLQLSLLDYWYIVQKRRRLAITFFLIAVFSTTLYSLIHPKIYRATARILIERSNQKIVSFEDIFPVETSTMDYYPTQYKILKSRTIGKRILEELNLSNQYAWSTDPVAALLRSVDIDPIKQSRLVDVSFVSTNPAQAADIANAVVRFYVEQSLNSKIQMTHQASAWLQSKSNEIQKKLIESELEFEAVKLKKELSDLGERYLPKHPKILRAEERINAIEKQLGRQVIENVPRGELSALYTQLEREVESNRKIYETMLSRLKETVASEGLVDTNVVVIDRAEVPTRPIAPRILLNIFLGILLGSFGAVGLCLLFESLDNTIKSAEDIEKTAALPLLGVVARWNSKENELIVDQDPISGVSEAFRGIRTSLLFSSPDNPLRSLIITSPHSGEGKSVIACNLAAVIAHSGARVLLIDADMRKPRLNRIFEQTNTFGLSHALTDSANFLDFIQRTHINNLSILFCGPIPPRPSELVGSKKMQVLIEKLKEHFDYIIFDSAPFTAVTDPVVLSTHVDGVIFVTRYNKTSKDSLLQGKQKFAQVQSKIVGAIINDFDVNQERYRYTTYSYSYNATYASDVLPKEAGLASSKSTSPIIAKNSST